MQVLLLVALGLGGAAGGRLLNRCIEGLPGGRWPALFLSPCARCRAYHSVAELLPLLGYGWAKGRCRWCGEALLWRVPLVEGLTGLLWLLAGLRFGASLALLPVLVTLGALTVLFFVDLEQGLVPDLLLVAGGALLLLLFPLGRLAQEHGLLWGLAWAVAGAGTGGVVLAALAWRARGGLDAGDVKLAVFAGLALGFPVVLVALGMAFVVGALVASALLLMKVRGRAISFGPFLSAGAVFALLLGPEVLAWYTQRFSLLGG